MSIEADQVTNAQFLAELARGARNGTALWVCGFGGVPNPGQAWGGSPYNAALHAAQVDGWAGWNSYFSVAAVKPDENGELLRRKSNFDRMLVLAVDDVEPDDVLGVASYFLRTSPHKHQVGIFLDPDDPDCADEVLCSELIGRMKEGGKVKIDKSGNSTTRYVRLPRGVNGKPEHGGWACRLELWAPHVRLSLADAAAAFGEDLDLLRAELRQRREKVKSGEAKDTRTRTQRELLEQSIRNIVTGEDYHDSINAVAASLVASRGFDGSVTTLLQTLMKLSGDQSDPRWQMRYADIPRSVDTARQKYGIEQEQQRAEDAGIDIGSQLAAWAPKSREALTFVPPVQWLVDGWIQRGLAGALVAEGSTGKTTAMLLLMCSIATGRPWLGLPVCRVGSSVLLSMDDSQDDLDAVLAEIVRAGAWLASEVEAIRQRVRVISLRSVRGLRTFAVQARGSVEPTGLELRLVEQLRQVEDLQLVGLDTLRMFSGGDSSDERTMTIATQAMTYMADQLQVAVAGMHHTGKGQSREDIDDQYVGAGSSAIGDNLRFILRLKKTTVAEAGKSVSLSGLSSINARILRLSSQRGSLRVQTPEPVFFERVGFALKPLAVVEAAPEERDARRLGAYAAALNLMGGQAKSKRALLDAVGGRRGVALEDINELVSRGLLETGNAPHSLRVSAAGLELLARAG